VNGKEDETAKRGSRVQGVFSGEEMKLLDVVLEVQNEEG